MNSGLRNPESEETRWEVPFFAFRQRSGAFSRAVHGQLCVHFAPRGGDMKQYCVALLSLGMLSNCGGDNGGVTAPVVQPPATPLRARA